VNGHFTAWTPSSTADREEREPWKAPMGVLATEAMNTSSDISFVGFFEEQYEISVSFFWLGDVKPGGHVPKI
jgi:hypothetical protein